MKKDNHYFAWGLTAVCVVCAVLLIYDLVFRDSIVMAYAGMLADILAPVLYGAAPSSTGLSGSFSAAAGGRHPNGAGPSPWP